MASGASPSLRTSLIFTGIVCSQNFYICLCQNQILRRILLEQQSYLYRWKILKFRSLYLQSKVLNVPISWDINDSSSQKLECQVFFGKARLTDYQYMLHVNVFEIKCDILWPSPVSFLGPISVTIWIFTDEKIALVALSHLCNFSGLILQLFHSYL